MSDKMPPINLDEMIEILKNPNFKTYLVFGKENDNAWKLGLAAQNFLAGVRSYLVEPSAQNEVRQHFEVPDDNIGVVFGHADMVSKTLDQSQANDFLTVTESIVQAE